MKLINNALLEQFDDYIRKVKKSDTIAIYHDSDPDGTCSGVIVAKALQRLLGNVVIRHIGRRKGEHHVSPELAQDLKKMKITKLITVDLVPDEKPQGVLDVQKFADVLIIDHHKIYADLNAQCPGLLMLKPQLLYADVDPQVYCTSKFAFDLMGRHVDIDDLDWVAGVGIIADVASRQWPDFLKAVFKKYGIPLKKDFFKSKLGSVAHTISSAEVYAEENVALAFDVVAQARNPDDVLTSVLAKYKKVIEDELSYFVKNAKTLAEFYDDQELIFYFFKPQHAITSLLSTIVSFKYPNKSVLVVSEEDGRIHVSARRQDKKIAVNNLLENAVLGFENANAGGHVAAAGATFPAKDLQEFKKRIIAAASISSSIK